MKRKIAWMTVFVLTCSLVSLYGCATTPNISFKGKDIASLPPLKVVRYKDPDWAKTTAGGSAAGALLLGGLGAGIATEMQGKKLKEEYALPDLGQLVMDNFVERIHKEIPDWPEQNIEEEAVEEGYDYSGALLEFIPTTVWIQDHGYCRGLCACATARMKDPDGNLIWQTRFYYRSKEFDRADPSLEEFEADNAALLKEEMKFASETIVSHFIKHFKEGK